MPGRLFLQACSILSANICTFAPHGHLFVMTQSLHPPTPPNYNDMSAPIHFSRIVPPPCQQVKTLQFCHDVEGDYFEKQNTCPFFGTSALGAWYSHRRTPEEHSRIETGSSPDTSHDDLAQPAQLMPSGALKLRCAFLATQLANLGETNNSYYWLRSLSCVAIGF